MLFHCFDFTLLNEWLGTCGEYFECVTKPFGKMSFTDMWKCNNSNLQDWFQTWSVVQLFVAVISSIASAVLIFLNYNIAIDEGISILVVNILGAWISAHVGWFAVVKKEGCCCFCICCLSNAPILLLLFGCCLIIWAALLVVNSVHYVFAFSLGFIIPVIYAIHAIPLLYMGMIMVKIWCAKKDARQLGETSSVVIGKASS